MKKAGLIREIYIKEKKTKAAVIVLFSKNHLKNELDKLKYEEKTSIFLKNYWHKIERDEITIEKNKKYSNFVYLNRNQKIIKKLKNKKRKSRKSKEEQSVKYWRNNHLRDRIEKALKELDNLILISSKNKFKQYKS